MHVLLAVLNEMPKDIASSVLATMEPPKAAAILKQVDPKEAAVFLDTMKRINSAAILEYGLHKAAELMTKNPLEDKVREKAHQWNRQKELFNKTYEVAATTVIIISFVAPDWIAYVLKPEHADYTPNLLSGVGMAMSLLMTFDSLSYIESIVIIPTVLVVVFVSYAVMGVLTFEFGGGWTLFLYTAASLCMIGMYNTMMIHNPLR